MSRIQFEELRIPTDDQLEAIWKASFAGSGDKVELSKFGMPTNLSGAVEVLWSRHSPSALAGAVFNLLSETTKQEIRTIISGSSSPIEKKIAVARRIRPTVGMVVSTILPKPLSALVAIVAIPDLNDSLFKLFTSV